jgi:hypothetical protein
VRGDVFFSISHFLSFKCTCTSLVDFAVLPSLTNLVL